MNGKRFIHIATSPGYWAYLHVEWCLICFLTFCWLCQQQNAVPNFTVVLKQSLIFFLVAQFANHLVANSICMYLRDSKGTPASGRSFIRGFIRSLWILSIMKLAVFCAGIFLLYDYVIPHSQFFGINSGEIYLMVRTLCYVMALTATLSALIYYLLPSLRQYSLQMSVEIMGMHLAGGLIMTLITTVGYLEYHKQVLGEEMLPIVAFEEARQILSVLMPSPAFAGVVVPISASELTGGNGFSIIVALVLIGLIEYIWRHTNSCFSLTGVYCRHFCIVATGLVTGAFISGQLDIKPVQFMILTIALSFFMSSRFDEIHASSNDDRSSRKTNSSPGLTPEDSHQYSSGLLLFAILSLVTFNSLLLTLYVYCGVYMLVGEVSQSGLLLIQRYLMFGWGICLLLFMAHSKMWKQLQLQFVNTHLKLR